MKHPSTQDFAKFLQHYLEENYPEKVSDRTFITIRSELAKEKFESIFTQTADYDRAYELAMGVLLQGYLFSKQEFISDILSSKFNICHPPPKNGKRNKTTIFEKCAPIFEKYVLTDDMLQKKNAVELETEITEFLSSLDELQSMKK